MDPVSQGTLGALAAQTLGQKRDLAKAAIIGALAGMAPDLDILITSTKDPLLALEFHRQFTHSLFFIPIGGLLCSLVFYPLLARRWGLSFKQTLLWCIFGYATHGLLDGCTSYGTQLFWPLTDYRISWDTISIIDPLFTLPILALVTLAARKKVRLYTILAIIWGGIYLTLGFIQHDQAITKGYQLAESRGHTPVRLEAKPSFANLLVWKVIYETEERYYVDAIRPTLPSYRQWEGDSIAKFSFARDLPWLSKSSQQALDVERFRWFSSGYIALDPHHPNRVIDMRYSLLPQQIEPLWGIALSPDAAENEHVQYYTERGDSRSAIRILWGMLFN